MRELWSFEFILISVRQNMTTNVTAIAANPAVDVLSEQVQQAIYQN